MKLIHPKINYQIIFKENITNVIVIENPIMFRSFIEEFINQCSGEEGRFLLSENENEIDISKNVELIIDYFALEFNQKKILTKVYNYLRDLSQQENYYLKTNELQIKIFQYLEELASSSEYPLVHSAEVDIISIFKAAEIKLEINHETLLEKLINYINIMQEFCGIFCIVFVNLKSYLTEEELKQLYTHASYRKVHIILLEGRLYNRIADLEKVFILDNDLCEIY